MLLFSFFIFFPLLSKLSSKRETSVVNKINVICQPCSADILLFFRYLQKLIGDEEKSNYDATVDN